MSSIRLDSGQGAGFVGKGVHISPSALGGFSHLAGRGHCCRTYVASSNMLSVYASKEGRTSYLLTSILSSTVNRARGDQRMEIRRINRTAVPQSTRRRRQPHHWPPGVWQAGRCCGTLGGQTGVLIKKTTSFARVGFFLLSKRRLTQNMHLLGASTLPIKWVQILQSIFVCTLFYLIYSFCLF